MNVYAITIVILIDSIRTEPSAPAPDDDDTDDDTNPELFPDIIR